MNSISTHHEWCPGNGTRYDVTITLLDGKVMLCWMLRGGSGGVCMRFGLDGFLHWTYMNEKMEDLNRADCAGLLALVHNESLAEVGMPEGYGLDGCRIPKEVTA